MLPLFLLLFTPAAAIGAGLLAYNLLKGVDPNLNDDIEVEYEFVASDKVWQMYEYYISEKEEDV